ncbi:hypothetical protein Bca101_084404 [Brassica carinata]
MAPELPRRNTTLLHLRLSLKCLIYSSTPNLEHLFKNLQRGFQIDRSLDMILQFVVLGLRLSLGFVESFESRYSNVGIQVLGLTPAPAPSCNIKNIYSPPVSSVYFIFAAFPTHPVVIIITTPLTAISYPAPLDVTTALASLAVSFTLLLVVRSTVQECGLAKFTGYYVIVAFPTHYVVSNIDGSSQSRLYSPLTLFLVTGTTVQECGRARSACFYVTAASPSHYAVSNIDGSSQSQLCDFQTGAVAQRLIHPNAFYLLSDVCSHTFNQNECDDCMLRSPSVTTCWA